MTRRFQFSLRALLVVIAVLAVPTAWYAYRKHQFDRECAAIYGAWQRVDAEGNPYVFRGTPILDEWTPTNCTIDPTQQPRQIDFHWPSGIAKGIYRWEGNRIRVRFAPPGTGRPLSFEDDKLIGASPAASPPTNPMSVSDMILERLESQNR